MSPKKYDSRTAAELLSMRKTVTLVEVAATHAMCKSVVSRVLNKHSDAGGGSESYRPRVLKPWPQTDFKTDELQVRN